MSLKHWLHNLQLGLLGTAAGRRRRQRRVSNRRSNATFRARGVEVLEERAMLAVTFVLDASLDDPAVGGSGFIFDSALRKEIIEEAFRDIGARLGDDLEPIPPDTYTITDPTLGAKTDKDHRFEVARDTIRVFVGGADWTGVPGIANGIGRSIKRYRNFPESTDWEPATITLKFDRDLDWGYNGSPTKPQFSTFVRHELLHGLGFRYSDTTSTSWGNLISGGRFTGPKANEVYGVNPPVDTTSQSHFASGVDSIMLKQASQNDPQDLTDLDWAALEDIGWEVLPVQKPDLRPVLVDVRADVVAITDTVQLEFEIRNDGPVDSVPFYVAFYVARDEGFFYPFAGIWNASWNAHVVSGVAANSTSGKISVEWSLPDRDKPISFYFDDPEPWYLGDEEYYVHVLVDRTGGWAGGHPINGFVDESNEGNNSSLVYQELVYSDKIRIIDPDPTQVVLAPADLSGDYFNVVQEPQHAGDTFDVDFRIRNDGVRTADPSAVRFYILWSCISIAGSIRITACFAMVSTH